MSLECRVTNKPYRYAVECYGEKATELHNLLKNLYYRIPVLPFQYWEWDYIKGKQIKYVAYIDKTNFDETIKIVEKEASKYGLKVKVIGEIGNHVYIMIH